MNHLGQVDAGQLRARSRVEPGSAADGLDLDPAIDEHQIGVEADIGRPPPLACGGIERDESGRSCVCLAAHAEITRVPVLGPRVANRDDRDDSHGGEGTFRHPVILAPAGTIQPSGADELRHRILDCAAEVVPKRRIAQDQVRRHAVHVVADDVAGGLRDGRARARTVRGHVVGEV